MNVVQISAEARTETGKKAAKAVRTAGKIPAVLYSKNGVSHFSTTHNAVKNIVYTPDLKLAEIDINGTKHRALVKSVDFHPVTDQIEHIDFLELVDGHPVKAEIPLKFKGDSPGVKNGGKLIRKVRTIQVKTTPEYLVDELFVDISKLKLGASLRVKAIEVPEGIDVLVDEGIPVANVIIPRVILEDDLDEMEEEEEGTEEASEESTES